MLGPGVNDAAINFVMGQLVRDGYTELDGTRFGHVDKELLQIARKLPGKRHKKN